jgi:hypothetical protein
MRSDVVKVGIARFIDPASMFAQPGKDQSAGGSLLSGHEFTDMDACGRRQIVQTIHQDAVRCYT